MGCGRIVTEKDIQQLRQARKGMQTGVTMMAVGHFGIGSRMINVAAAQLNKVVGDIGERLSQRGLHGESAHNLNRTVGPNSRIYDVGSRSHIASVKTYGVGSGKLSSTTCANYVRDLRTATGYSQQAKDVAKFEAAARDLRQASRTNQAPFPDGIRSAQNDKAACEWLRQNAELRVPDDHVKEVAAAVQRSVLRNPTTYGLPANAPYAERAALARQLSQQVQPMGISVSEIEKLVDSHL